MTDIEIIKKLDALPFSTGAWQAAQRLRHIRKHLDVAVNGSEMGRRVIVGNLVKEGGSMKNETTLTGCDEQTREKYNQLCREDMKRRLLADIMVDLTVCDMEGWDKMEYIGDLFKMLDEVKNGKDVAR